jgi:hypothetical protein
MNRNKIIDICSHNRLQQHKQCVVFHEAGHAVAIYLNNNARNLPPVFFQILFNVINGATDYGLYQSIHDDSIAKVEGGRLIHSLPYSIDGLAHTLMDCNETNEAMAPWDRDYITAFEADIVNLLIGPLAEAKYVYNRDDELFNHKLVDLNALKNYGGDSDLKLVREYLECFSSSKQQQNEKLEELFAVACDFVSDYSNWKAINKLACYILESNKNIISCEEVVSILES